MYLDSRLECPDLIQWENSLKDSFIGFKPGKDFLTYPEIAKFDNTIGQIIELFKLAKWSLCSHFIRTYGIGSVLKCHID